MDNGKVPLNLNSISRTSTGGLLDMGSVSMAIRKSILHHQSVVCRDDVVRISLDYNGFYNWAIYCHLQAFEISQNCSIFSMYKDNHSDMGNFPVLCITISNSYWFVLLCKRRSWKSYTGFPAVQYTIKILRADDTRISAFHICFLRFSINGDYRTL